MVAIVVGKPERAALGTGCGIKVRFAEEGGGAEYSSVTCRGAEKRGNEELQQSGHDGDDLDNTAGYTVGLRDYRIIDTIRSVRYYL